MKIPAWVPFTGHRTDAGVVDLGLKAPFFLTRAFLPLLEAGGTHDDPARAINVGSIGGLRVPSFPTYSYSASKAGLHHLTRVLARELGPRQITVNAVAPGPFESSMMAATLKTFGDAIIAEAPLRRIGRPTIRAHPRGDREAGVRARPAADPFGPFATYCAARLAEDPHLWATTLFDEVTALGFECSYPTFTRQLRARSLRPHCEPRHPRRAAGTAARRCALHPHPAGHTGTRAPGAEGWFGQRRRSRSPFMPRGNRQPVSPRSQPPRGTRQHGSRLGDVPPGACGLG